MQRFILDMLKSKGIPVIALKALPFGFGSQVEKLLLGDPYEAHQYFADMLYQVQQLLDQDKEWDPLEVVRRRELAEAEKRAEYRASLNASTSGQIDDTRSDRFREVNTAGYPDEALFGSIPYFDSAHSGQQAEI